MVLEGCFLALLVFSILCFKAIGSLLKEAPCSALAGSQLLLFLSVLVQTWEAADGWTSVSSAAVITVYHFSLQSPRVWLTSPCPV